MRYRVFLTVDADNDVSEIYRYVLATDSHGKADALLEKLLRACKSLEQMPCRGHVPPEMEFVGLLGYLEIHFKPYRIIYQIAGKRVFIHAILDGRRSLQELLERRLLR